MKMLFGKYRGEDIEDIPTDYLRWFAENINPISEEIEKLIKACDDELQFRLKYGEQNG